MRIYIKGIRESICKGKKTFLADWPYHDLYSKIQYKAAEYGIEVRIVNPKYTSQRCSKCGNIDINNRPDRDIFICQKCGFKAYADYNAAKNLSFPDIEKLIQDELRANHQ